MNYKDHYKSIVARGLISPTTKDIEFALKAEEDYVNGLIQDLINKKQWI